MPYIKQEQRSVFDQHIGEMRGTIKNCGQLNYVITCLCRDYVREYGMHYSTLNEVVGVLECAKLELVRRLINGYESDKAKENGDVY